MQQQSNNKKLVFIFVTENRMLDYLAYPAKDFALQPSNIQELRKLTEVSLNQIPEAEDELSAETDLNFADTAYRYFKTTGTRHFKYDNGSTPPVECYVLKLKKLA